jgi:hypothetical protein
VFTHINEPIIMAAVMTAAEIGQYGERHAAAALQAKGWQCHRDTQQPGSTDIEARSGSKGLLVLVKAGLSPALPPTLPSDERRNIASRATNLGYEAWLAQLQIGPRGELIGSIRWTKLN